MLRWASMVFRDEDGVIHYCRTDEPMTVCGESRLRHHDGDCCKNPEGRYCQARTLRLGDGLPLSPISVLPQVTCILCIAMEETPAWA